jgi:hypothetical protein
MSSRAQKKLLKIELGFLFISLSDCGSAPRGDIGGKHTPWTFIDQLTGEVSPPCCDPINWPFNFDVAYDGARLANASLP